MKLRLNRTTVPLPQTPSSKKTKSYMLTYKSPATFAAGSFIAFISCILLEVFHAGLEYLNILLAVDIDGNAVSASLGMRHLTKASSVC